MLERVKAFSFCPNPAKNETALSFSNQAISLANTKSKAFLSAQLACIR
jgi:hypothetical protein